MTIDKLYDLREKNFLRQVDIRKIDLLLQAVTDWPKPVDTIEHYIDDVKIFLQSNILTFDILSNKIKKINAETFPWELESLTSLLELSEMEKDKVLESSLLEYNERDTT